ncbi:hypothetical protein PV721_15000 [Streptomyces sp. MB09-01]|uniref:hypothetical protein n=1 Tax=Streptomyces sp. MB09-01 TaxID=3028666 RepID=UPI0029A8B39F|nr:hypothetical protein [Streptomyces sp. MB09-01]MDX3535643.1 hypothetical protein [Streptomyces sp. MB09-01]
MRGRILVLAVTVAACAVLSGCTDEGADGAAAPAPGPTVTSPAAPPAAAALAERYRRAGGDADVYGIEQVPGPDGATPLIVVRTHNPDTGDDRFKQQAASVTAYLTLSEGVTLPHGYRMDVFGPDGRLLHRWNAAV